MKLYSYLDLPKFEYIDDAPSGEIRFHRPSGPITLFGRERLLANYYREAAHPKYYDYVYNLIPEMNGHVKEISFQYSINDNEYAEGVILGPHTDGLRGAFCVAYNISVGGPNVTTYWYKLKDKEELVQSPVTLVGRTGQYTRQYGQFYNQDLEVIDNVVWEEKRWCMFRSDVIHNIETVYDKRLSFSIGFDSEKIFYEIMEKYGGS